MRSLAILVPFTGPADENTALADVTRAGAMRVFESGASRNDDTHKHDPEGFWSPLVMRCYNEYLHGKRFLRDGTIRASDNWQLGMPRSEYAKSLLRHIHDFWLHHRGWGDLARASLKVALCAIMFNAMGYLHELLKEERNDKS